MSRKVWMMCQHKMTQKSNNSDYSSPKNEFWDNPDYQAYKQKHGMHFSDAMAMYASRKMQNSNQQKHIWSVKDVQDAFASLKYELPEHATWGDATYAANMYYADFAPVLKTEVDAVRMAYMILYDPDGYEGMLFNRYTADVMQTNAQINWKDLM